MKGYSTQRTHKLIKIYADKLFQEAHKENSQIDLFDYENCNLRLKLAMWKDILKTFQTESEQLATTFDFKVEDIFLGVYTEYIKKLASANYLRGIFDELIRYSKYYNMTEWEQKLQLFNDKRKEEKMSGKQERDYFFKEFNGCLMNILQYIDQKLMIKFEAVNPKEALVEIKKWNNIINFKKNSTEVKSLRESIAGKFGLIVDRMNNNLQTALKS